MSGENPQIKPCPQGQDASNYLILNLPDVRTATGAMAVLKNEDPGADPGENICRQPDDTYALILQKDETQDSLKVRKLQFQINKERGELEAMRIRLGESEGFAHDFLKLPQPLLALNEFNGLVALFGIFSHLSKDFLSYFTKLLGDHAYRTAYEHYFGYYSNKISTCEGNPDGSLPQAPSDKKGIVILAIFLAESLMNTALTMYYNSRNDSSENTNRKVQTLSDNADYKDVFNMSLTELEVLEKQLSFEMADLAMRMKAEADRYQDPKKMISGWDWFWHGAALVAAFGGGIEMVAKSLSELLYPWVTGFINRQALRDVLLQQGCRREQIELEVERVFERKPGRVDLKMISLLAIPPVIWAGLQGVKHYLTTATVGEMAADASILAVGAGATAVGIAFAILPPEIFLQKEGITTLERKIYYHCPQ